MAIVQSGSGQWAGATSASVALPGASTSGSLVAVVFMSQIVIPAPSGWTERVSDVNWMGNYVFTRTGDGATSWTFTFNSSSGIWFAFELPSGASFLSGSATQSPQTAASSRTTPTVTPTAGARLLVASVGGISFVDQSYTIGGWTNSFVELAELQNTGANRTLAAFATREVTADGSTGYSTTATYTPSIASTGTPAGLIAAFVDVASAPTVNAGTDVTDHSVNTQFTRTATETLNGDTVTARAWTIQAGPAGVGSTIGTAAALAWTPTVAGTYTLRYTATFTTAGAVSDDMSIVVVSPAQTLQPNADVTTTGWSFTGGASANAVLAGTSANDSTYATSPTAPTGSVLEVGFADPQTPAVRTDHSVTYRVRSSGATSTVVAGLYQGTTLIASETRNNVPAGFTTYTLTLTEGEAQAISDYSDLRLRLTVTAA